MAENKYSQVTAQMVHELSVVLAPDYAQVAVGRGVFNPETLPDFYRYCVFIAPSPTPWDERRLGVRQIQDVFRIDIYAFVKNWDATENPLFGTCSGEKGLFQFVQDIKDWLRLSTLGGLIDKTYDEAGGDNRTQGPGGIDFHQLAVQGMDDGYIFVFRSKIPYLARAEAYCHAVTRA
jgi:hypothetical protein